MGTHKNNNNNNNTIWRGSVLTGEEPPPHSGELKHALTQAGGPSQLSRPMSSGHHISMEHRLRRKHLFVKTLIQMLEKKETNKEKHFFERKRKRKRRKKGREKRGKDASKVVVPETGRKIEFFQKEILREMVTKLRPKKNQILNTQQRKNERTRKNTKEHERTRKNTKENERKQKEKERKKTKK